MQHRDTEPQRHREESGQVIAQPLFLSSPCLGVSVPLCFPRLRAPGAPSSQKLQNEPTASFTRLASLASWRSAFPPPTRNAQNEPMPSGATLARASDGDMG